MYKPIKTSIHLLQTFVRMTSKLCLNEYHNHTQMAALPAIPPPKRVRRFDVMPPTPPGPTFCPVCKEDLGSVAALGAHYNSFHAIRDNRLVTKPSFQCSRCELVFHSKWRLRNHSCSSGDKLLSVKQVGSIASTVRKPQPAQWLIATDGSASPVIGRATGFGRMGFLL